MRLADQEVYSIGDMKFNYHKITNQQFNELEKMKVAWLNEPNVEKGSKLYDDTMRKSAKYFFGIDADYDNLPKEDLSSALEAASYRTLYGKPFLSPSSPDGSLSAAKSESPTKQPPSSSSLQT